MSEITRGLWVRIFVFGVWLALATGALAIADPEPGSAAAGVVLLSAVAGLSVTRPFRGSHLLLAALAAASYAAVQALGASEPGAAADVEYLRAAAVGGAALLLTAVVADQLRRSLRDYDEELYSRLRVIDEIQAVDPQTGAVKSTHAARVLSEEVERARRYDRSLAVVLFGPDGWEDVAAERGVEAATRLVVEAAAAYRARLRTVDTLIQLEDAEFAVLLPETGIEGAQVVAEKMTAAGTERIGATMRAGIAVFPLDAVTGPGLMAEAEQALAFARAAAIVVASRALLA